MKPKLFIKSLVTALVGFILMYFMVTSHTFVVRFEENRAAGPGIIVDNYEKGPMSFCAAEPDEYFEIGLPFVYEKGTRPCGLIETSTQALGLNIAAAALIGLLAAGIGFALTRQKSKRPRA